MIRRIILENYMAHGRTVIEPAAGLTVLVGPNNCGKSAVVHALQTLCYNRPADFAVRHGETDASVTVETDDGHVLTWQRKKGVVSYVINGREVGRLRRDVPDDLHQYLRMPRIEPANESSAPFFVHFGLQKSPIFLLDDPPARAATFFASSSDAEKLLEMQKRHREKVKDAKRDHDRLASEAAVLDRRLEATAPVTVLAERMTAVEETHRRLVESDRTTASRRELADRLARATRRRDAHALRLRAAAPLMAAPPWADTSTLAETIARMKGISTRLRREKSRAAAVEPLLAPPAWRDTSILRQLIAKIRSAAAQSRRSQGISRGLAQLAQPPEPIVQRAIELSSMISRGKELTTRRGAAKAEMLLAQSAIDALREQARAWVEAHPNCPTCGAPTTCESVLEAEHEHV